jgi:hypothetical protein
MRAGWRAALLTLLLMGLASCGDEATAPKPAELAGTWTATKAEYVSKSTSSRVDIIAAGGAATLVLTTDSRYEYIEIPSGGTPDTTQGGWSASADVMTFTFDPPMTGNRQYDLYFSGNTLRLTGGGALHDFGAGAEECTQNLALSR